MIEVNPKFICGEDGDVVQIVPTSEAANTSTDAFTASEAALSNGNKSLTTTNANAYSSLVSALLASLVADTEYVFEKWKVNVKPAVGGSVTLSHGDQDDFGIVPFIEITNVSFKTYDKDQVQIKEYSYDVGDEIEIRAYRVGADVDYKFYLNGVLLSDSNYTHIGGSALITAGNAVVVTNGFVATLTGFGYGGKYTRRIADAMDGITVTGSSSLQYNGTTSALPNRPSNVTLDETGGNRAQVVFTLNDGSTPPNPVEIYLNLSATLEITGPNTIEIGKPYFFNANHPVNWEGNKGGDFTTSVEGQTGVVFVASQLGTITIKGTSVCNPSLVDTFQITVVEASDSIGGGNAGETVADRTNNFYIDNVLVPRVGRDSAFPTELGACEEINIQAVPLWHPIAQIITADARLYGLKFNGVRFVDFINDDDNYFVNKTDDYIGKYNSSFSFASRINVSDSLDVTKNYHSVNSLDTKNVAANSTFGFRFGSFGAGFVLQGTTGNAVGNVNLLQYSIETNSGTFNANTNLALNVNHSFQVKLNKTLGRIEFIVDGATVYTENMNVNLSQTSGDGAQSATYNGNAFTGALQHVSAVEGGVATFQAITTGGVTSSLTVQRDKAELLIVGNPVAGQVGKSYVLTGAPAGAFYGINGALDGQIDNDYNPVAPKAVFTPSAEGDIDLTFTTENGCVVHINQSELTDIEEFRVYGAMTYTPQPDSENNCVIGKQGEQIALVVSGGSGDFKYVVSGGNKIAQNGLVEIVGTDGFAVTVLDNLTNVELSIPFCVEFNAACVNPTEVDESLNSPEACCDVVMECNDAGQVLQAPSFLIDQPKTDKHNQIPVLIGTGVTISPQFAEISSLQDNATADVLPKSQAGDSFFARIISQLSLIDINAGAIRFGFKGSEMGGETALVFFTDGGTRKVKIENDGVLEAGSTFEVVKGREFAYGFNSSTKKFELYVNNIRRFTSENAPSHCGVLSLQIKFATSGLTIGGAVKFDSLTNKTNFGGVVIQSENKYTPPASGFDGVEILEAVAGEFRKEVHIRVIQPILKKTRKNAFQFGVTADVYIGQPRSTRDSIRLSAKGIPDAAQNPCMEWMGKTKTGVTITLSTETQKDKADDLTVLKWITDAVARIEFDMLSVNDLELVSKVSNGMLKQISANHWGIGLPDYVEPFRVLIVFQIGGKGSNTYRVYELSNANSENELAMSISNQGERSAASVVIEATPDDSKPDASAIGDIWTIADCRYSNAKSTCSVG